MNVKQKENLNLVFIDCYKCNDTGVMKCNCNLYQFNDGDICFLCYNSGYILCKCDFLKKKKLILTEFCDCYNKNNVIQYRLSIE